jgi:Alpha-L-fucosidase
MGSISERRKRTQWFMADRFGLFIHWGLYAIPARGEWVMSVERQTVEEYRRYFEAFDPDRFDPAAWARAARRAGMKYAVLTAKHHDGFCLFDSKLTDYKSTNTKAGRDLVADYLKAFRAEGLKVGLYYSLLDWHHPDYPAWKDRQHPLRDDPAARERDEHIRFDRYLDYMHGQVRELCTNYGKIDILWFDFSYDEMSGEKWRGAELMRMIRELQPTAIVDNRLEGSGEGFGSITSAEPGPCAGDFACPEMIIPYKGLKDETGEALPWEACFTMNNNWGYHSGDRDWKRPELLVRKLVECSAKDGNMILNVGPNARGEFPSQAMDILEAMGEWMSRNGMSIYGCGSSGLPKPDWGWYTRNGERLYAHVLEGPIGPLCLPGIKGKAVSARFLADGSELKFSDAWNTKTDPDNLFVNCGPNPVGTYPLPDPIDTVIEIRLKATSKN